MTQPVLASVARTDSLYLAGSRAVSYSPVQVPSASAIVTWIVSARP